MGPGFSYRRGVAIVACAVVLLGADRAPIVQPGPGETPWDAAAVSALDADLDAMLAASPALRGAHAGVYVVDTATGNVLYSHGADDEYQPASTLKLVVGSTALDRLGPEFVWTTSATLASVAVQPAEPEFVLKASGDPTLATSDLADAVAKLPRSSVRAAVVDDSALDDVPYADGWTWDDFGEDYAPSVSAATVDENVIEVRVTPGRKAGDPASVDFTGAPRVLSASPSCDASTGSVVEVRNDVTTGLAGSDDTVDATLGAGRCSEVVGSIPLGAPSETISVSMFRPIVNMHDVLGRLLFLKNVRVATAAIRLAAFGTESVSAPFWSHRSKPLSALLGPRFWIPSDNLFGELLLKQLGLAASGKPGTTAKGTAVEQAWLASIGVDPATVTLADGCGMSQYDRITPHDLVTILQHDWNGPNRQLVLDSLPVGGARGTIEGIAGTPAAGRTFAKTGSMMHVRGLAGYLATQRHGAATFAFEVDDWNGSYPALAALRAQLLSRIVTDPS